MKRHFIFHDADFINEQRNSANVSFVCSRLQWLSSFATYNRKKIVKTASHFFSIPTAVSQCCDLSELLLSFVVAPTRRAKKLLERRVATMLIFYSSFFALMLKLVAWPKHFLHSARLLMMMSWKIRRKFSWNSHDLLKKSHGRAEWQMEKVFGLA